MEGGARGRRQDKYEILKSSVFFSHTDKLSKITLLDLQPFYLSHKWKCFIQLYMFGHDCDP